MPRFNDFVQLQNTAADPVVVGDTRVTPQAQALVIRFPFGGFVWNRPTAVLVERDDMTRRIPIVDGLVPGARRKSYSRRLPLPCQSRFTPGHTPG